MSFSGKVQCQMCPERSQDMDWHRWHVEQFHCSTEMRTCHCGRLFPKLNDAREHFKHCNEIVHVSTSTETIVKRIVQEQLDVKLKEMEQRLEAKLRSAVFKELENR